MCPFKLANLVETGNRYGQLVYVGVFCAHLVGGLPFTLPGLAGQVALHQVALLYHRHDGHLCLGHRAHRGQLRPGVCRLGLAWPALLPDPAHGPYGSSWGHLEAVGLRGVRAPSGKRFLRPWSRLEHHNCILINRHSTQHSPTGINHHRLYWLLGAHLFLFPRLPGREGRQRKVHKLCRCSLVGRGKYFC